MNVRKIREGADSPYVAFKDDRERKWALVSRDIRWILVAAVLALGEVPAARWQALWRLISGG
jgi:hypothetical protein